MKKILALGKQEFSKVINNNCIYVDKTKDIYKLVTNGDYYFLSRPRRFGKSLLANTLKELFLGSKELFKGLWIYDKWDWEKTYPVIKISFSEMGYKKLGVETAINKQLDEIAKSNNLILEETINGLKFKELIKKLSKKAQVAIIIDEYDKPIIDYMDDIPQAEKNREDLKSFYSILKDADSYIKFLFITGVSKFAQVSIFSDLNNLVDITINKKYSTIVGWTKEEVEKYFPEYLKIVAEEYKDIFPDIMPEIQKWYNGYSWDGITKVYNPFSLMSFFETRYFSNFWFTTGTPTMLMDIIKNRKLSAFNVENSVTSSDILNKYDFTKINLNSLLFQTGYLTIKNINLRNRRITLDYPNQEVEESFSKNILTVLTNDDVDLTQSLLFKIADSFSDNTIDKFINYINILFKKIPYTIIEDKESYYHSLFYLVMKMTGFQIEAEVLEIDGRIDAVIKTDENIYIIEFKINQNSQKAIDQIQNKQYALKYADDTRTILLMGINFDTENKRIDDYQILKFIKKD